jgi:hypothetical protein
MIPLEFKQDSHMPEEMSILDSRNRLECDLSEFEPLHFPTQFGLHSESNGSAVSARRLESRAPTRKDSNDIASGLWNSMDQLSITAGLDTTDRSGTLVSVESMAPPQFSDKFLIEDESTLDFIQLRLLHRQFLTSSPIPLLCRD